MKTSRRRRRPTPRGRFLLPLLWPLLAALSPADCRPVERAHGELLGASFEVERRLRISMNGDLKRREVARLRYAAGDLETEILDEETLSKGMVFEPGGADLALDVGFACERVEDLGGGRYSLSSADGSETAEFALDAERGALRPLRWRLQTIERLLFKKLSIEGSAEYVDHRWTEGEAADPR